MATSTSYIPVELYLRSEYEPDAEYVDGVIEERPVGELDHVLWQKALIRWFMAREGLAPRGFIRVAGPGETNRISSA